MQSKGRVVFITVRPKRSAPVKHLNAVMAIKDKGLEGDYYGRAGNRQVTLIQIEDIKDVAIDLTKDNIDVGLTRRNIVVEGIDLLSLKGQYFKIGDATLQYTGICEPCNKMNKTLGPGGFEAMKNRGGITAKVITEGKINVGDVITLIA